MSEERCPGCNGPVRFQSGAPGWCDRCQPLSDVLRAFFPDPADPAIMRHELTARTGAALIAVERARQIQDEGYSIEHDEKLGMTDLEDAAIAYLVEARAPYADEPEFDRTDWWPWSESAWKPGDRLRMLVKAGALVAAAIDLELHVRNAPDPTFDPVPDPGEEYEARFETASDGGEL